MQFLAVLANYNGATCRTLSDDEEDIHMNIKLFTALTLIGLVAIFTFQNAEVVELRFLFWGLAMSRALMFIFILLIGVAVGWLLRGHMQHHTNKDTKEK